MFDQFNEVYLYYKRFLPQKAAYKMAVKKVLGGK